MITKEQCKAARGLLNWSQSTLAEESGLTQITISAFEKGREMRVSNNESLKQTFEAAGVEFIPENGGGPGVRLKKAE